MASDRTPRTIVPWQDGRVFSTVLPGTPEVEARRRAPYVVPGPRPQIHWQLPADPSCASARWKWHVATIWLPGNPVSKKRGHVIGKIRGRSTIVPRRDVTREQNWCRLVWDTCTRDIAAGFDWVSDPAEDYWMRVAVFRAAPKTKRVKYPDGRNPRRGDLIGMTHLVADAMEGAFGWFADDSQVRMVGPNVEFLHQDFGGGFSGLLVVSTPPLKGLENTERRKP